MSHSRFRSTTAWVLTWVLSLAGTLPVWAATKGEMHAEMITLASQVKTLKPRIANDPSAAASYEAALSRYSQLSQQMGGDDPGQLGVRTSGSNSAQLTGAKAVQVVPTAPPNCTPATLNFANNTPVAIPTGPAVVTSTVAVAGAGPFLWDLDLTTNITHTFAADLDMTIQSPAGTIVTLSTDNGAGNDNVFNGTLWDDDADVDGQVPYTTNNGVATDHAYVNLTLASPLVVEEALAAFVGENPNGTWTITISDDLAGDGGSLDSWALAITTFPAAPTTTTPAPGTNNTPVAIPTGPGVVTSTITIAGAPVGLCAITVQTNMQHSFAADLDVTLQSPAGTVVTLTTDNGAGNDNVFDGTVWSDDANPGGQVPYTTNNGVVTDHAYVNLTLASPLVPEEALGAFLGEDPNGTWTLTISDDLAGDGGNLNSWAIAFQTCTCAINVDHSITKTDGLTTAAPGQAVTYTITASNAGPQADPAAVVADTFPAALTGATWTCVGAGGGTCTAAGAGNINDVVNLPAGGSVTYTVNGTIAGNFVGVLSNTATVTGSGPVTDTNAGNNSATDTTTVVSASNVVGEKSVTGDFSPGGAITYTVVLSNTGAGVQLDNPGDEFVDVLPADLDLVSATATSGTAVANLGTNTVTWNGSIPAAGSVTITIDATIDPAAVAGATISNQGTVNFDGDGNGSNETSVFTDDPDVGGGADPTDLTVTQAVQAIPTLSTVGLAILMLAMAFAAFAALRRRRPV
jgi:uncharacterized repeat protein (TIGR01451 family)